MPIPRTASVVLAAALGTFADARASIVAFWQPVTITPAAIASDPALADMQCWDLMVTTSGNWASAGMRAFLPTRNVFYKHDLGGTTRPNSAFVQLFPALEFTTHIDTPSNYYPGPCACFGGFPENQPFSLGNATAAVPGTFSVSWGDLLFDPPGTFRIARLTFPHSAVPNVINIPDVGQQGSFR